MLEIGWKRRHSTHQRTWGLWSNTPLYAAGTASITCLALSFVLPPRFAAGLDMLAMVIAFVPIMTLAGRWLVGQIAEQAQMAALMVQDDYGQKMKWMVGELSEQIQSISDSAFLASAAGASEGLRVALRCDEGLAEELLGLFARSPELESIRHRLESIVAEQQRLQHQIDRLTARKG